jgi:ribosomal protein L44E
MFQLSRSCGDNCQKAITITFSSKPVSAMPAKKTTALAKTTRPLARRGTLLGDVRRMILEAREKVARTVDASLVALNWHVGTRIRQDILKLKRAEYGE